MHKSGFCISGGFLIAILGFSAEAMAQTDSSMSFFITGSSIGQGGNLGGLAGADAYCQKLADSVGAGAPKVWHAYLSTQAVGDTPAVNARDRIGTGPWFNANKVMIAANLTALHDTINLSTITGSRFNGMAPVGPADSTCANWTSSAASNNGVPARTIVGHHNRQGIAGNMIANSWNQAHVTPGCSQANVESGGGAGNFYCFAVAGAVGVQRREAPRGAAPDETVALYYLSAGRNGFRGDQVVYRFTLDQQANVEVSVVDIRGQERALLLRARMEAGPLAVRWNGTDDMGEPLPAGVYRIVMNRGTDAGARAAPSR